MSDYDLNGNRFHVEYIIERGELRGGGEPLTIAAALSAGLRIAEGVAAMTPKFGAITVDATERETKKPDRDHAIARALKRPNAYMTGGEFIEHMTLRALFEGTARAYIHHHPDRIEFHPIPDAGITPHDPGAPRPSIYVPGLGITVDNVSRRNLIEISNPRWDVWGGTNTSIKGVLG